MNSYLGLVEEDFDRDEECAGRFIRARSLDESRIPRYFAAKWLISLGRMGRQ